MKKKITLLLIIMLILISAFGCKKNTTADTSLTPAITATGSATTASTQTAAIATETPTETPTETTAATLQPSAQPGKISTEDSDMWTIHRHTHLPDSDTFVVLEDSALKLVGPSEAHTVDSYNHGTFTFQLKAEAQIPGEGFGGFACRFAGGFSSGSKLAGGYDEAAVDEMYGVAFDVINENIPNKFVISILFGWGMKDEPFYEIAYPAGFNPKALNSYKVVDKGTSIEFYVNDALTATIHIGNKKVTDKNGKQIGKLFNNDIPETGTISFFNRRVGIEVSDIYYSEP